MGVMPGLYSRLLFIVTLVFCLGAGTDPDGRLYPSSADPLADVQQALGRADDGDRLALVVLGANWCHDSRALASRLHRPPLAEIIQQHYELVFVDVGFYNKGRDVLQQFGVAHYYATPTVLIIDPSSRMAIPDDIRELRDEAQQRVSEGEKDIQLVFPEYPLLSWESE
jgi:thiol-disulfide isomerase/thioredoxin